MDLSPKNELETNVESKMNNLKKMAYLTHKAGMDTINKDEIAQKVYEASKDSAYYAKQQKKTEKAKL